MMEQKFLAYVLYVILLEIREKAYETNDTRLYHLADMLHNVPFSLLDKESAKLEYSKLLESVESLKIPDWLESRLNEFNNNFPNGADPIGESVLKK